MPGGEAEVGGIVSVTRGGKVEGVLEKSHFFGGGGYGYSRQVIGSI